MKLERIRISNFRCFGPEAIEIQLEQAVTGFVGNNGSGKTAIFHALARLFGVNAAQRSVRKSDFHVPADVSEITPSTSLSIECLFGFPEVEDGADDDAVPEVFQQMCASGEDEPLKVRIRLQATWEDDLTPDGTITEEIKWIRTLDDDFEWDECAKVQAVDRALVQLIYVPASRNASDQVTNLLKSRLWRAAEWSDQLGEIATEGALRIQTQFDEEEPAQFITQRLEARWREVHQGDTDARPLLRLVESRLEDLLRRAEFLFFPDEAQQTRRLEDLSDGQRSLFHIALTAAALEMERDALAMDRDECSFDQEKLKRTHLTLLAIEEPENSLSPFFLSRIMGLARSIGGMVGAQVVISSHSASILGRIEAEEVRYARIDPTTRRSSVRALTLPPAESDERRYVRLAVRAYPELYFARFVVLAEGESEAVVIPRVAEATRAEQRAFFMCCHARGGRIDWLEDLLGDAVPRRVLI